MICRFKKEKKKRVLDHTIRRENKTNVASWAITDARVHWKLHSEMPANQMREQTKRQIVV